MKNEMTNYCNFYTAR